MLPALENIMLAVAPVSSMKMDFSVERQRHQGCTKSLPSRHGIALLLHTSKVIWMR